MNYHIEQKGKKQLYLFRLYSKIPVVFVNDDTSLLNARA